ncbi:hypothetical protein IFT80_15835 [Pseudomonas sp. CFBP 8771]|uniref:hypothetical protein n=1 Tax=Pseudomonas sp. CFBP 8771 TaxID=2775285 RepID=UPI00177FE58D|nr:hypothetical protein [Pseudomonas sp. CFBP 8771]MBD8604111.1 hypothetical protein [Pseudomonas sp. CFBP 8771]
MASFCGIQAHPTIGREQRLLVYQACPRMRANLSPTLLLGTPEYRSVDSLIACRGATSMRRKPDLLWTLVILLGLGIVTTGYAQSLWASKADTAAELVVVQASMVQGSMASPR